MQRNDRIARALKLKDLHTFRAVVQHGSMSKAAAELALTPPAITKVIADMEKLLGVRLLERTPHGVEPTRYGEALLQRSVNVFDELEQTIEYLASLADPTVGDVRIGVADPWMGTLIPAVIDRLTRRHPRMVFHVAHANRNDALFGWLRAREIDVLIARLRGEPEEDIERESLFDDPLVVVTGRDNPKFRGPGVRLAQLVDEAWCMPHETHHVIGVLIAQAFRAEGVAPPKSSVNCASMQLQAALAATGRFLTVMGASYLRFGSGQTLLRIVPVELRVSPPPIGLATLKHRMISPATGLFIETLRAVVRDTVLDASAARARPAGSRAARGPAGAL